MEGSATTLKILSRQHNDDKNRCQQILESIRQKQDKKAIQSTIINFWEHDLKKHVDREESVLIPFLVKNRFNYEYVNVLKREHDTIRLLAQRLPMHDNGITLYKVFIDLVDQHTRFEGNVIIRKMQENFSEQELKQLDNQL
jgi:hemerythrin-like domain-containing protein